MQHICKQLLLYKCQRSIMLHLPVLLCHAFTAWTFFFIHNSICDWQTVAHHHLEEQRDELHGNAALLHSGDTVHNFDANASESYEHPCCRSLCEAPAVNCQNTEDRIKRKRIQGEKPFFFPHRCLWERRLCQKNRVKTSQSNLLLLYKEREKMCFGFLRSPLVKAGYKQKSFKVQLKYWLWQPSSISVLCFSCCDGLRLYSELKQFGHSVVVDMGQVWAWTWPRGERTQSPCWTESQCLFTVHDLFHQQNSFISQNLYWMT